MLVKEESWLVVFPVLIIINFKFWIIGCPMLVVKDPLTNTMNIDSVPTCTNGFVIYTEFWNMKNVQNPTDAFGYWHNEDDVKNYVQLEKNGSITVSLYIHIKI